MPVWPAFRYHEAVARFTDGESDARGQKIAIAVRWDNVGMSANARLFWIIPALVASWLAVRSLAASPAREQTQAPAALSTLNDPPVPLATLSSREVHDPALARFIGSLAAQARR